MFCLRKEHRYIWCVLIPMTMANVAVSPIVYAGDKPSAAIQKEFIRALGKGDHEKVRALVGEGVDVNAEMGGLLPIMMAKDAEMVELLVGAGADVDATGSLLPGQTALMQAAMHGNVEVIQALIRAGVDINRIQKGSNATALEWAIMQGKTKAAEALIKAGADVNAGRFLGMPPLHFAISTGLEDIVRVLVDAGADLDLHDETGQTPLMKATAMRRKKIVKILLDAGAEVNKQVAVDEGAEEMGAGGEKGTAMDIAVAGGDPEIIEMLKRAGAKGSERPPTPDRKQPNPPGRYALECSIHDPPPIDLREFACSEEGQVVDRGVETIVFSTIHYEEGRPVPMKDGCEVELGIPGKYRIIKRESKTNWRVVCNYRLRGIGIESWLISVKRDKSKITETEGTITVAAMSGDKPGKEGREPPSVKIVKPVKEMQFSFDNGDPGVLEIEAKADITGDCDEEPVWKVDGIDGSKKTLQPATPSSSVTIRFEGLPQRNDAFGKKRITASACGQSDSVTAQVFFPPEVSNHPGKGSGETPNWFYYWLQTKAGKGFHPMFKEEDPCAGKEAVAAYWFNLDKIVVYRQAFNSVCMNRDRRDGPAAKGIDCIGESLIHESIHQEELKYWWNNIPPSNAALGGYLMHNMAFYFNEAKPATCYLGNWEFIHERVGTKLFDVDSDGDLVPDYIEKAIAGCDPNNAFSCPGVPKHVMAKAKSINHKIDVDMNTYRISWKKWKIGSADKEDWSKCGKQWKDRSMCP